MSITPFWLLFQKIIPFISIYKFVSSKKNRSINWKYFANTKCQLIIYMGKKCTWMKSWNDGLNESNF